MIFARSLPLCGEERRWTERGRGEQQVVREKEEERSHTHTPTGRCRKSPPP
jgi:hypothetical protein